MPKFVADNKMLIVAIIGRRITSTMSKTLIKPKSLSYLNRRLDVRNPDNRQWHRSTNYLRQYLESFISLRYRMPSLNVQQNILKLR